jgi:hypothetical protein
MNGLSFAVFRVRAAERRLLSALDELATAHSDEAEVKHVATDLATWSLAHLDRIDQLATEHDMRLDDESSSIGQSSTGSVGEYADRFPPSVSLLEDMALTYLLASQVSLSWELLSQVAKATRMNPAQPLAAECQGDTVRQMHWANTMLKTLSPQVLATLS